MDLPNELLIIIFQYLSPQDLLLRCSFVSQIWFLLAAEDILWKKFTLSSSCQILNYDQTKSKPMSYKKLYKKSIITKKFLIHCECISILSGLTFFINKKYTYCYDLYNSVSNIVFGGKHNPIIYIQKGQYLYKIPCNSQIIKLESQTKILCHEREYNISKYLDCKKYLIREIQ